MTLPPVTQGSQILLYCNRVVKKYEGRLLDMTNIDILINSLSIVGNAFAISFDAAKEVTFLQCRIFSTALPGKCYLIVFGILQAQKHDFVISLKFL